MYLYAPANFNGNLRHASVIKGGGAGLWNGFDELLEGSHLYLVLNTILVE
jgi:hypothetical protein